MVLRGCYGSIFRCFLKNKRKLHSWECRHFVVVYLFECCTSVWHSLPCTSKAFLFSRHTFVNGGPAYQTEFSPDSSCLWSRAFTLKSIINVTGCRCTQCLLTLTLLRHAASQFGTTQFWLRVSHLLTFFFFFFLRNLCTHTLKIMEERWQT